METNFKCWNDFFTRWPTDVPRRGILVTTFNEQITFVSFLTTENFLLLERQTPDSQGARLVILSFDQILAMKIFDVLKPKQIKALGFEGVLSIT
jgi:hypothetical protein